MTLAEFLLARIAEDETAAHAATPGPLYWDDVCGLRTRSDEKHVHWRNAWGESQDEDYTTLSGGGYDTGEIVGDEGQKAHIVRWDRARVLRECEAKRRIVEWHIAGNDDGYVCRNILCPHLAVLASVYSDHPDYDPAWAV